MEDVIEIIELEPPPQQPVPAGADLIYRLAGDAKTRVRTLRLRPTLWDCLLKVNGKRDAGAIAGAVGRPLAEVLADLDRLCLIGLIHEPGSISLSEHMVPQAGGARPATPVSDTSSPAPAPSAQQAATAEPGPGDDCSEPRPRSLQCLLRLIRGRFGSGRQAELVLYRIFTAVPRHLFMSAGIRSFLFIDDATVITDPELMHALINEARKQLDQDICPELRRCLVA